MNRNELDELQDQATWDDETAEVLPPVQSPRAVVSVAFSREDFTRVARYARDHGMKTSEFIRLAALDRLSKSQGSRQPIGVSVTGVTGDVQRDGSVIAPKAGRPRASS